MLKTSYLPSLLVLVLLSSCTNYKLNYSTEVEDWQQTILPSAPPVYQVYLIGDAGAGTATWTPPALSALQETLTNAPENSAVIFLGDNIYRNGLAPNTAIEKRAQDEYALDLQLNTIKSYAGRTFFIAGNHDWQEYNIPGLRRQSDYLQQSTNNKVKILPKPGCGDPVEVKLTDDLTLLLLDSQWWMDNWAGENEINDGCEAKSRADFAFLLQEAMKSNRRKELLIATHHPIFSHGPHGGNYTFKEHIFPLRELHPNLYLPLPFIGSAFRFFQASIGTRQDLANANYKDYRKLLINQAITTEDVIFASGHEHSLQYWESEGQYFIVSGAGSKMEGTKTANDALFAYGGYGFSQLSYYEDGQVWVQYYQCKEGESKRLVFQKQIKPPSTAVSTEEIAEITDEINLSPSVRRISEVDFSRSKVGEAIWGKHWRSAYSSEMEVQDLDLAALNLFPVKRGGGFQTNSLRLEDHTTERQYTLRSIDKDASRTVPYPLNTNLVLDVVRDNFSASHPLAALAVAPLAEAAGVYHANPQLVYLPQQKALGEFNEDYAGALYLFEERPDDEHWQEAASFVGNPEDIISTFNMIEKVRKEQDERVDQRWTIRSRLFDLVIGDWDRHDDQWRWGKFPRGENNYFRPIPRDRDQAFANYDGSIFRIARLVSPKSKQWRPFNHKLGRTHWATYNAFLFDQSFLTGLSWPQWQEAVAHLQTTLSNEIIDTAFVQAWPEPFLSRDAPSIKATIMKRRDQLMGIAKDYYLFLAKNVDVLGTDQKDRFLIERLNDRQTRIRVYNTNKEEKKEKTYYERIFSTDETQNIYCYGLGDDDIFEVRGSVTMGCKIHLIGGEGEDLFDDQSETSGGDRQVSIYDFLTEDNRLLNTADSRDRRSKHPAHNLYNRRSTAYQHNFNALLPLIGFNPDDKLLLGFSGKYTRYGFRKTPFASEHEYGGLVSISTGGLQAYYRGNFSNIIGQLGLQFSIEGQTPLYANNFYGLGNETLNFEEERGIDFHRIRKAETAVGLRLAWRPNRQTNLWIGPKFIHYDIEQTAGRFLDSFPGQMPLEVFEDISYFKVGAEFNYKNTNDTAFPSRGFGFLVDADYHMQLDGDDFNFPSFNAEIQLYQQIDNRGKFVFATQLGLQHRFSDDFPFFLGARLGGLGPDGNLRGFRRDRFTGRTAFYHNTDLRWKLGYWNNNAIPMALGLTASFDYGKVSLEDIESDTIHYSYGGGVFFSPFDLLTVHIGSYKLPTAELRWLIRGGFFF